MIKIMFFLIVLCFGKVSCAQVNIKIEGFGNISCPQSMEVQGGNYKAYVDKVKEINGVSASNVIFQQQGLNEGVGGLDTYARVMIKTTYGDFNSISTPVSQFDVNDVNRVFENKIKSEAYSNNAVILSWSKAIATSLNGYKALKFGYGLPPYKSDNFPNG